MKMSKSSDGKLNCPHCGVRSEVGETAWLNLRCEKRTWELRAVRLGQENNRLAHKLGAARRKNRELKRILKITSLDFRTQIQEIHTLLSQKGVIITDDVRRD
jgi:hypothetical protein